MIHQALLAVFSLGDTLAVTTTGRHYNRHKQSRALATKTNLIEMKQQRCGTMPMECLLQCNQLPACPALNAFNNGTCELLLSPVLGIDFLADCTAYIHRFADTTNLMPATTSMPAVTSVTSQQTEPTITDKTCPGGFRSKLVTRAHASCYKFELGRDRTWMDARNYCVSLGGDLVDVETQDEMGHLSSITMSEPNILNYVYWSSGRKVESGKWMWSSTGGPVNGGLADYYDVEGGNFLGMAWSATSSYWTGFDPTWDRYPLCEIALS